MNIYPKPVQAIPGLLGCIPRHNQSIVKKKNSLNLVIAWGIETYVIQ